MSPIRLVTFDVTNTMIRVLGGVGQNYATVAAHYGRTVDPAKIEIAFRKRFKLHMLNHPNFGVNSGISQFKWWTSLVEESFKEAGYDGPSLTQIANHLYIHFASSKGWEVMPGTLDALESLKRKGLHLGIISNFDNRLEKIIHELSLAHYFDFMLDSATFGEAKPNYAIFDYALQQAKTEPNEALHVGDNVMNDYHGALNVGMGALLFLPEYKEIPDSVNADHVIRDLCEIDRFVD